MKKQNRWKYAGILAGVFLCLGLLAGCSEQPKKMETAGPAPQTKSENAQAVTVTLTTAAPTPTVSPTPEPTMTPTPKPTATPVPTVTLTPQPTATPVPTATPTPQPTAVPSDQSDGTLSKPDHPLSVSADKRIFIGDSRTEGLRDAVGGDNIWSCLSSMGYDWMTSTGVPQIEDEIGQNTAVIILMGVNDIYQVGNYINYINAKASEWTNLGATTYFVSVGPVQSDPYVTNAEIESFNASMQANLIGVTYIDIYSYLVTNGFSTLDGTHYPDNVSVDIYNYIVDHLEESRSGIWG